MPIIDIFASSEKIQNMQLPIAGILLPFREKTKRREWDKPGRHFRRRGSPPQGNVGGGAKTALTLYAIS
ncbi:MAG: hypothetical protein IIT98_07810 [Kiritimatiellae bacterium]|nr:hypothetical protein [Kiritimatiellia bacterium]